MKISLDWLRQYVDITVDPIRLADMLTMTGFEVEAVIDPYEHLGKVVTGRLLLVESHPNTDKLVCCKVDTGDTIRTIVCGAPNVKPGMNAPCALPGAVLPSGLRVESDRIRGVLSEGMLCSESELGLGTDKSGIMFLDDPITPGTPLYIALGLSDSVFEIGLTPNRPDCLSFIGIAREVGALLGTEVKIPETVIHESGQSVCEKTSVEIFNPDLCPRYSARLVCEIKVKASPPWLQRRLLSIGVKPINNIVDITNFVMMETGQPLHAFDYNRLYENRIIVRTAQESERTFTTLDGKERLVDPDALMICDGRGPVAVAGVMGGKNSEIEETTKHVLIESAHFNPVSIRKTAKSLGLSTDASYRFERGVDPEGTVKAMNRAAALIKEIAGGDIAPGIIDEYPVKTEIKPILLNTEKTNARLGTCLTTEDITRHLSSIEFEIRKKEGEDLEVIRPSFRFDVERPEDLMEEVARLSGYNAIITTFPVLEANTRPPLRSAQLKETFRDMMAGFGFSEAIHYSFTGSSPDKLEFPEKDPRRNELPVLNPLSEAQAVMRTTLVGSLLEACQKNMAHQERNLRFFEIGKSFYSLGMDKLPDEINLLAAVWSGSRLPLSWLDKTTGCDFYDMKGVLDEFLYALKISQVTYTQLPPALCAYTRPGRSARIFAKGTELGLIGEIKSSVLKRFDVSQDVFVFEINIDALMDLIPQDTVFSPVPKFPATSRDMTLIMDKEIESGSVLREIENEEIDLIEDVVIFDVYGGKPIEEGKKSVSIRITYRSHGQTLEDTPVNTLHQTLTQRLLSAFNADVPGE